MKMSANNTLRDALFETLNAINSPDNVGRQSAEDDIKIFEVTDDYGWHLTEITLSPQVNWPTRQLAAVLLKRYVQVHWTPHSHKFQQPEISLDNKQRIRQALLTAIGQPITSDTGPEKRLMSSIAFVVAAIGHNDWPEEWPELMPVLLEYISSRVHSAIYASMKIFAEMCHEVIDTQIPVIAPVLLPRMLEILQNSNEFSIRTRSRAVQVFTFLTESIIAMGEFDKVSIGRYLDPVLPHFVETLINILQLPDTAVDQVDIGLRKDALDCLTILLRNSRKRLSKYMPLVLSTVWHSLTCSASVYVNTVVNSNQADISGSLVDSDGESIGLESFIFSIFEFVTILIATPKLRKLIKQGLADLIYYLLIYMQMTDDQIEVWSINPDQFVDDEDDESYSVSVRLSAQDVLLSLCQEFEENESPASYELFKIAFVEALKRHFTESNQIKLSSGLTSNNNSHSNWWKIQESCLLALGSLCSSCIEVLGSDNAASSDLKCILDTVLMGSLDGSPFFSGRLLWTAARFVEIMPPPVIDRFLQITVQSFANPSPVMKICAVRAVIVFSRYFSSSNRDLLLPYLQPFLDGLLSIGIQYSSEVLALVLETMCDLVKIDDDFTTRNESKITPLAMMTFLRHSSDPLLVESCEDLFAALARIPSCSPLLQERMAQTLNSILVPTETNDKPGSTLNLQVSALEILASIVRSAPVPLSDTLMQLFLDTVTCILNTSDDNSTLQNGGECIRAYINRSTDQVLSFRDSERNGLQMVLQVCLHLLDPRVNESCSAFVGRLISALISKAGNAMGPDNVHLLLRSVLSKLQNSESLSVIQSLVLVFANLIHFNMQTVLVFLSSIPGPTGSTSALQFVLTHWLGRQQLFFGMRDRKITILALCKLLEYSLQLPSTDDNTCNLNLITVAGDPIVDDNITGIRTRSKSRNVERWTQVPCTVKILKILLSEINTIDESRRANGRTSNDDNDDDDNDDDDMSGDDSGDCDVDCDYDDDDDDSDDESLTNDPISSVNLNEYLLEFVCSFSKMNVFSQFHEHLNEIEKQTVANLAK